MAKGTPNPHERAVRKAVNRSSPLKGLDYADAGTALTRNSEATPQVKSHPLAISTRGATVGDLKSKASKPTNTTRSKRK